MVASGVVGYISSMRISLTSLRRSWIGRNLSDDKDLAHSTVTSFKIMIARSFSFMVFCMFKIYSEGCEVGYDKDDCKP